MSSVLMVLWQTVRGALIGFFIFGFCGLVVAVLGGVLLHSIDDTDSLPMWAVALSVAAAPIALAVAGSYVLAMRGMLTEVTRVFVEKQIVPKVYERIRPRLARVATAIRGKTERLTQRELLQTVRADVDERRNAATPPSNWRERWLERSQARLDILLANAFVLADGPSVEREALVERLESSSVETLESLVAYAAEAFFYSQLVSACAVVFIVTAVPYVGVAIWLVMQ